MQTLEPAVVFTNGCGMASATQEAKQLFPAPVGFESYLATNGREISAAVRTWLNVSEMEDLMVQAAYRWKNLLTQCAAERERDTPFPADLALAWLEKYRPLTWSRVYGALHGLSLAIEDTAQGKQWRWYRADGTRAADTFFESVDAVRNARTHLELRA